MLGRGVVAGQRGVGRVALVLADEFFPAAILARVGLVFLLGDEVAELLARADVVGEELAIQRDVGEGLDGAGGVEQRVGDLAQCFQQNRVEVLLLKEPGEVHFDRIAAAALGHERLAVAVTPDPILGDDLGLFNDALAGDGFDVGVVVVLAFGETLELLGLVLDAGVEDLLFGDLESVLAQHAADVLLLPLNKLVLEVVDQLAVRPPILGIVEELLGVAWVLVDAIGADEVCTTGRVDEHLQLRGVAIHVLHGRLRLVDPAADIENPLGHCGVDLLKLLQSEVALPAHFTGAGETCLDRGQLALLHGLLPAHAVVGRDGGDVGRGLAVDLAITLVIFGFPRGELGRVGFACADECVVGGFEALVACILTGGDGRAFLRPQVSESGVELGVDPVGIRFG